MWSHKQSIKFQLCSLQMILSAEMVQYIRNTPIFAEKRYVKSTTAEDGSG